MTKVAQPPIFATVRSVVGAIVADPIAINTINYPEAIKFENPARKGKIVVAWEAGGGTVAPADFLDLQVLVWAGPTIGWVEGPIAYGVQENEVKQLETSGGSPLAIRVVNAVCAAGTGLSIYAAEAAR